MAEILERFSNGQAESWLWQIKGAPSSPGANRAPSSTSNPKLRQARPEIDQAFMLLHSSILTTSARPFARSPVHLDV